MAYNFKMNRQTKKIKIEFGVVFIILYEWRIKQIDSIFTNSTISSKPKNIKYYRNNIILCQFWKGAQFI